MYHSYKHSIRKGNSGRLDNYDFETTHTNFSYIATAKLNVKIICFSSHLIGSIHWTSIQLAKEGYRSCRGNRGFGDLGRATYFSRTHVSRSAQSITYSDTYVVSQSTFVCGQRSSTPLTLYIYIYIQHMDRSYLGWPLRLAGYWHPAIDVFP